MLGISSEAGITLSVQMNSISWNQQVVQYNNKNNHMIDCNRHCTVNGVIL